MKSVNSYARVVADSVSSAGVRLISVEVCMHRFVLAELNTHRVFSRNSASSRAIPVEKMLERFATQTAFPVAWTREQPGMQGGAELEDPELADAQRLFWDARNATMDLIDKYLAAHPDKATRLHKSRINRLMEWGQWHTVVITSTAWENFLALRTHAMAEPEIRVAADLIRDAINESKPRLVLDGEWHLPYITDDDRQHVITELGFRENSNEFWGALVRSSAACAARTSYLTQDKARDFDADFALYERLTSAWPMHASPLEHPATPDARNRHEVIVRGLAAGGGGFQKKLILPKYGNFLGWQQNRIQAEALMDYQSFA